MWLVAFFVLLITVNGQAHPFKTRPEEINMVYITEVPPDNVKRDLPPIIMLHGIQSEKKTWLSVAPLIANNTGRKIYMLDARNHGDSPWSDEFDVDILANDVDHFMTEHNIPKAVIVGHSMGGRTAITLALQKPAKVEMAIIEDATTADVSRDRMKLLIDAFRGLQHIITLIPSSADETAARKFVLDFITKSLEKKNKGKEVNDVEVEELLNKLSMKKKDGRWAWKTNFESLVNYLENGNLNLQHEGQYSGAVLFIYGLVSEIKVEDDTDQIRKYFPNVEFVGVQAGHMIHNTLSKIFSDTVSKFINAH